METLELQLNRCNTFKYVWQTMTKGQNLLIKCDNEEARVLRSSILRSCRTYVKKQRPDMLFTTRITESGLEVWRLK